MKSLILFLLTLSAVAMAAGETKIPFNYKNADIPKVIEDYSKASGQKFIIDPAVHGKITILSKNDLTLNEAFNELSSALAVNDVAISKQDDTMIVMQARSVQRNLIEVGSDLPPLKPERMYTWMVKLKNVNAEEVNKQLRILTSRDGELVPFRDTNQIVITDWTSNLYRVAEILKRLDENAAQSEPRAKAKPN